MDEITHLLDTLGMARLIPHAAALAFAYGLALPIGWDREREERSAGLRTFPLVALASCGFVQVRRLSLFDLLTEVLDRGLRKCRFEGPLDL